MPRRKKHVVDCPDRAARIARYLGLARRRLPLFGPRPAEPPDELPPGGVGAECLHCGRRLPPGGKGGVRLPAGWRRVELLPKFTAVECDRCGPAWDRWHGPPDDVSPAG